MKTKLTLKVLVLLTTLIAILFPFIPANAAGLTDAPTIAASAVVLPAFEKFVATVQTDQAGVMRGVYVPGVFAFRVAQQPYDMPGFVSTMENTVTQFRMAAQYGTIGILAHNYLAGASFTNLAVGQEIRIVYGDSKVAYYKVNGIYRYQALQPNSQTSNLKNLDTGDTYSVQDIFTKFYQGGDNVTFQTCIETDGISTWGRLFVTAAPFTPEKVNQSVLIYFHN